MTPAIVTMRYASGARARGTSTYLELGLPLPPSPARRAFTRELARPLQRVALYIGNGEFATGYVVALEESGFDAQWDDKPVGVTVFCTWGFDRRWEILGRPTAACLDTLRD